MKQRNLKVSDDDWEQWKKRADEAGLGMSEWIRERCNENHEKQEIKVPTLIETRPESGNGITTADIQASVGPISKKIVKACTHGQPKGYNCWQCGGLAKVEG